MSDLQSETGFTAPAPQALAPYFPEYQITNLVATGGMGAVYRAVQTSLDREVAIKILPAEFGSDAAFCEAFEAEAKAMARLNHPNLIGVYDFGEVSGTLFIVMEFVAGQSLHDACHGVALEANEAMRLITGVAQGLAHAHDHGILHRDIKPANILLDGRLQPKIGDFGLARPVERKVQEGEAIFGTPGYTAPEVLAPPHQVDQRADIFSLGVLMHELLTGKLPLDDPRPPSLICQCDPRLDNVVRKASHKNPNARYQHASEIVAELEKISTTSAPRLVRNQAVPIPAAVRGNTARYASPAKSGNKGLIAIVVLLVAALALGYQYRDVLAEFRDSVLSDTPGIEEPKVDGGPSGDPVQMDDENVGGQEGPSSQEIDPEPVGSDSETLVDGNLPDLEPEPVEPPTEGGDPPVVGQIEPPTPVEDPPQEEVIQQQPQFDVEGLFQKARSVMRERCQEEIAKTGADLYEKNIEAYASNLKTGSRNHLDRKWWDAAAENIEEELKRVEANGGRLPEKLDSQLKVKPWAKEIHSEYLRKEAAIRDFFGEIYAEQAKTYIRGLELRLPKLREANDSVAYDLIQQEIDKVLLNPEYFRELMLEQ